MTITAAADASYAPPRNEIAISVPSGAIMDTVSVWRNKSGVRTDLRSQPSSGFTSRTVYDYECPYGVPVTYGWSATYIDSSATSTVWTEPWASLASWTTSGASWAVSAGKLVWTAGDSLVASITRAVTSGRYRITFAAVPTALAIISFGGFYIDMATYRLIAGSQAVTIVPGTTTWVIDVTPTSVLVTTSAGTYSVAASVSISEVTFTGPVSVATYDSAFGTAGGSGGGSMQFANSVAVDSSGNRYVTDLLLNRVTKFNSSGVYVTHWGTTGSADGQFSSPRGIAVDSSNNIYVADANNNRIQKFTSAGVFTTKWGTLGSGNGQMNRPCGVVADSAGAIYVTDSGNHRVQKFTNTGTYTTKWGSSAGLVPANGTFTYPLGIAVTLTGSILVGDQTARVQEFTNTGTFTTKWGSAGSGNGEIGGSVRALAVDASGVVYLADSDNGRVQKFTSSGVYLSQWTRTGWSFNTVSGIAVDTSFNVLVAYSGGTVHRFTQASARVDDVTLSSYGATASLTEESSSVTLSPVDGWLIHPATPALSFPLASSGAAGIRSIGEVRNASKATVHDILGSSTPVTTTNGNRAADVTSMVVAIDTYAEEVALKALLEDETPLLVNIPPALGVSFDYGFYQVGDTSRGRLEQMADFALRDYVLPLVQVQSPIVTQSNTGWSWAALAVAFPTWAAVLAAYETWADVATDTRRPGF